MRHIMMNGYFDSQNKLQHGKLSIDDSDPSRVIAHFRIRGRHDVMTWILNTDVSGKYQAQQVNKAREERASHRRGRSQKLSTAGR